MALSNLPRSPPFDDSHYIAWHMQTNGQKSLHTCDPTRVRSTALSECEAEAVRIVYEIVWLLGKAGQSQEDGASQG
jgi:hypothetical protein